MKGRRSRRSGKQVSNTVSSVGKTGAERRSRSCSSGLPNPPSRTASWGETGTTGEWTTMGTGNRRSDPDDERPLPGPLDTLLSPLSRAEQAGSRKPSEVDRGDRPGRVGPLRTCRHSRDPTDAMRERKSSARTAGGVRMSFAGRALRSACRIDWSVRNPRHPENRPDRRSSGVRGGCWLPTTSKPDRPTEVGVRRQRPET